MRRFQLFTLIMIAIILSLISSCIHIRCMSPTKQYNVYILDGFSDMQKESIIEGFHEWETASMSTVTFIQVNSLDHYQSLITVAPISEKEMEIIHKDKIGWATYHGSDTDIIIVTELGYRDFYQTVLHEFGHALGLDHDLNLKHAYRTTMMEHTLDSTARVTCLDLRSLCLSWGCDANEFIRCKTATDLELQ